MQVKKILTAVLALSAALSLGTACSKNKATFETDANGNKIYTYNFNMYVQDDAEYPKTNDTVFDNMLREKFGIKFNYDRIARTDWQTKTNTNLAVGDVPDVTIGGKETNYKTWAADGFLASIDYEKLPNWCRLWGDDLDKVISLASSSDGKLYYLPTVRQEKVQMCWLFRKDILDELGLSYPKTKDEFLNVCQKIKEKHPQSIIISSNGQKKSSLTGFFQMFFIPEMILQDQSCVDPVTGEFVPYAMSTDNAREMYKFINQLYKEGYLDKEILSVEKDNFYTRCAQDNAFITYNYVYNTELLDKKTNVNGKNGARWEWSPNMITAYPEKGTIYKKDPLYSNWGPAFGAQLQDDPERFDAVLQYYDWCASPEGQLYTTYGVEGGSYNMVDGQPQTAEGWYHEKDNTKGKKITAEYGILTYTFIKHPKMFHEIRGNDIDKLYKAYTEQEDYYYFEQFPMRYTSAEEKDYTDLVTALNAKRDEYMARFMMGESDPNKDSDWNRYLSDLKKVGLDKFEKLQNEVYKRTQEAIRQEQEAEND